MKKRLIKLLALLLALTLTLAGCAEGGGTEAPADGSYPQAEAVMEPDTVVMTMPDGDTISWAEYYYWLVSSVEMSKSEASDGALPGWDEEVYDGLTLEEYTKKDAAKAALLYRVVEDKAGEMGVTLSESDREQIASLREDSVEHLGSEEEYAAYLRTSYLTEELYIYFQTVSCLYYGLFVGYFGASGSKCTDEDAVGVAENEGYLHAAYIAADSEEGAKALVSQLDAAGEGYMDAFTSLMADNSGEELFCVKGELTDWMQDACAGLDYNKYSGPLDGGDGFYYVVLRLPIDPDAEMDEGYTVRYYAATAMFENIVSEWAEQAEAEARYEEAFEGISPRKIFGE